MVWYMVEALAWSDCSLIVHRLWIKSQWPTYTGICCLSEVYNYKSCVAGEYWKAWGARDLWQLIGRKWRSITLHYVPLKFGHIPMAIHVKQIQILLLNASRLYVHICISKIANKQSSIINWSCTGCMHQFRHLHFPMSHNSKSWNYKYKFKYVGINLQDVFEIKSIKLWNWKIYGKILFQINIAIWNKFSLHSQFWRLSVGTIYNTFPIFQIQYFSISNLANKFAHTNQGGNQ